MPHNRHEFLTESNSHLLKAFACFVKPCLYCCVLHVKLLCDRSSFLKGFLRFLLLPDDHIDVSGKSGDHSGRSCSVLAHVFEHRGEDINTSKVVQALYQHEQTLVGGSAQCLIELFKVKPRGGGNLVRVLEQVHDEFRQRGSRHLYFLTLTIKNGGKAHNLRDGHIRLRSHTGKTLRKLRKVRSRCCAVL